jgi:hypothetical protein
MDRRRFLQSAAAASATAYLPPRARSSAVEQDNILPGMVTRLIPAAQVDLAGHTFIGAFELNSMDWKVYEDLRTRDGGITFLSPQGARVLTKTAEPSFSGPGAGYLGLALKDVGMSPRDLLAERLLDGDDDPDPERVRAAAPPLGSTDSPGPSWRLPWDTFVGTREAFDTMPVFAGGNTRTYHPIQFFPEDNAKASRGRLDGLVGGWLPAVRKVLPISDSIYDEVIVFADVEAGDQFIVQTWHRTARVEEGQIKRVVYGYSYPEFPPARIDPKPEEFYRALLLFAGYWDHLLRDCSPVSLPDPAWVNMARHAFARELMVRPGGVYPKYGAVDRDYYGSEYDGFQDVFTSSLYANLEWARFEMAHSVIDNYFTDFVDQKGMINMRGPETAQFGMTLSLLARYYNYTGDGALLRKHRAKIEATVGLLSELHDQSLRLPKEDPGYGLIHGWSESDSCLMPQPNIWWLPYFANNAFTARGLRDLSRCWPGIIGYESASKPAGSWKRRGQVLEDALVASLNRNLRHDMDPAYIGTFPGTKLTFLESLAQEHPSAQQWPHRGYCELLQADVLPRNLAHLVIDCMRAYGATTLGVVANVERPHPEGRDILGFISYGYAQMLLRLDRVEDFLLFLYSHRYHDHTRGSWTAGEVAGIDGDNALFCIPAQLTIPLLVRWMLVLEDSDEDRLYFGKGLPRDWLASGTEIVIDRAPSRWGRVSLKMIADLGA